MRNGYLETTIDPACQIKRIVNTVVTNITRLGANGRHKSFALFPVRAKKSITGIDPQETSGLLKGDTLEG